MAAFALAGFITKAVVGIVPSDTPHVKGGRKPYKFKGSNKKRLDPTPPLLLIHVISIYHFIETSRWWQQRWQQRW
jgi:hypothetical protein